MLGQQPIVDCPQLPAETTKHRQATTMTRFCACLAALTLSVLSLVAALPLGTAHARPQSPTSVLWSQLSSSTSHHDHQQQYNHGRHLQLDAICQQYSGLFDGAICDCSQDEADAAGFPGNINIACSLPETCKGTVSVAVTVELLTGTSTFTLCFEYTDGSYDGALVCHETVTTVGSAATDDSCTITAGDVPCNACSVCDATQSSYDCSNVGGETKMDCAEDTLTNSILQFLDVANVECAALACNDVMPSVTAIGDASAILKPADCTCQEDGVGGVQLACSTADLCMETNTAADAATTAAADAALHGILETTYTFGQGVGGNFSQCFTYADSLYNGKEVCLSAVIDSSAVQTGCSISVDGRMCPSCQLCEGGSVTFDCIAQGGEQITECGMVDNTLLRFVSDAVVISDTSCQEATPEPSQGGSPPTAAPDGDGGSKAAVTAQSWLASVLGGFVVLSFSTW